MEVNGHHRPRRECNGRECNGVQPVNNFGDIDPWTAWAYKPISCLRMCGDPKLFEANLMLIPKNGQVGDEKKVFEDAKKDVVNSLLKASGCLDYSVNRILAQIPAQVMKSFPCYLQEGMLEAISIQTLAQCVEIQLGLASKCEKATLSVKRRLAYELVTYFSQAHYCLSGCNTSNSYGKKLLLFLKWKCMEAKAASTNMLIQ
ncbi:hypothetical protein ABZP36_024153 [Zizania latifolia]